VCRNDITAPPSVCVPDVPGALVAWIPNQKKIEMRECLRARRFWLSYYCILPVWRSCCNWRASCVVTKKNYKTKHNIKITIILQIIKIPQYIPNTQIHPLQNNIHISKVHCRNAFLSQVLPGFLITAPHLCGVPAVIGALAVR